MVWILTLRIDPASQDYFDELRRFHHPAVRNHTQALLTMFHQLPESDDVLEALEAAAKKYPRFKLRMAGLRAMGGGVAYVFESPVLTQLHRQLASAFQDLLIPQDKQKFVPHITIQKEMTTDEARIVMARLQARSSPPTVEGCGMDLWEYLNGARRYVQTFQFPAQSNQVA